MENNLLMDLRTADRVLTEVFTHLYRSNALRMKASNLRMSKATKWKIALSPLVWFIALYVFDAIYSVLPKTVIVEEISVFVGMAFMVVFLAMIPVLIASSKKKIKAQKAELLEEAEAENKKASDIKNSHAKELSFLPSDYRYPSAVEYILESVQTGRSKTLGEALDRYDEYLHRKKLEDSNDKILKQQRQMASQMSNLQATNDVILVSQLLR